MDLFDLCCLGTIVIIMLLGGVAGLMKFAITQFRLIIKDIFN